MPRKVIHTKIYRPISSDQLRECWKAYRATTWAKMTVIMAIIRLPQARHRNLKIRSSSFFKARSVKKVPVCNGKKAGADDPAPAQVSCYLPRVCKMRL